MEDKMNFPNEIWAYEQEVKMMGCTSKERQQRYIHESKVPISCGGTMEDTNDWCRSCFVQNPCGNAIKRRDEAVLGGKTLSQVAKEKAMNKDNYVTLPVALRLGLKGIFLDTEKHWEYKIYATGGEWHLSDDKGNVPAPNMSELWRELPLGSDFPDAVVNYYRSKYGKSWPYSECDLTYACVAIARNPNKLAELLMFVKGQGKEKA
jgi:hypothetical protein